MEALTNRDRLLFVQRILPNDWIQWAAQGSFTNLWRTSLQNSCANMRKFDGYWHTGGTVRPNKLDAISKLG